MQMNKYKVYCAERCASGAMKIHVWADSWLIQRLVRVLLLEAAYFRVDKVVVENNLKAVIDFNPVCDDPTALCERFLEQFLSNRVKEATTSIADSELSSIDIEEPTSIIGAKAHIGKRLTEDKEFYTSHLINLAMYLFDNGIGLNDLVREHLSKDILGLIFDIDLDKEM